HHRLLNDGVDLHERLPAHAPYLKLVARSQDNYGLSKRKPFVLQFVIVAPKIVLARGEGSDPAQPFRRCYEIASSYASVLDSDGSKKHLIAIRRDFSEQPESHSWDGSIGRHRKQLLEPRIRRL